MSFFKALGVNSIVVWSFRKLLAYEFLVRFGCIFEISRMLLGNRTVLIDVVKEDCKSIKSKCLFIDL